LVSERRCDAVMLEGMVWRTGEYLQPLGTSVKRRASQTRADRFPTALTGSRDGVLFLGVFPAPTVGSRPPSQEVATRLASVGWPVRLVSTRSSRLLRLVEMMAAIWTRRGEYACAHVDVFSGRAFVWAAAATAALRLLRKPVLLTLHGGNLPTFATRWPRVMRWVLGSAAAVTAPSAYLLEAMRSYAPDLALVPNGIEPSAYTFRVRSPPRPRLLWLRAFHRIYAPALAPRVLAQLSVEFPDATLTMVGPDKRDGSLDDTLRTARELGVAQRLRVVGGVPKTDVPRWLAGSDIFLNTATIDNLPVSVLEAMAAGLCVVTTDVGGIRYVVDHGAEAFLVPSGDARAMAAAVGRILRDPGLAAALSTRARATAERYGWSAIMPVWNRLFEEIAARRDRRQR